MNQDEKNRCHDINYREEMWERAIERHLHSYGVLLGFTGTVLAAFLGTYLDSSTGLSRLEGAIVIMTTGFIGIAVFLWLSEMSSDRQIRFYEYQQVLWGGHSPDIHRLQSRNTVFHPWLRRTTLASVGLTLFLILLISLPDPVLSVSLKALDIVNILASGAVGLSLVVIVEYIRRPGFTIELLPTNSNDRVGDYQLRKIRVVHKSRLGTFLWPYSHHDVKVRIHFLRDGQSPISFQSKADGNPEPYAQESAGVALALAGVTLKIVDEGEKFLLLAARENEILVPDLWALYYNQSKDKFIITPGRYLVRVEVTSDQSNASRNYELQLGENVNIRQLSYS